MTQQNLNCTNSSCLSLFNSAFSTYSLQLPHTLVDAHFGYSSSWIIVRHITNAVYVESLCIYYMILRIEQKWNNQSERTKRRIRTTHHREQKCDENTGNRPKRMDFHIQLGVLPVFRMSVWTLLFVYVFR